MKFTRCDIVFENGDEFSVKPEEVCYFSFENVTTNLHLLNWNYPTHKQLSKHISDKIMEMQSFANGFFCFAPSVLDKETRYSLDYTDEEILVKDRIKHNDITQIHFYDHVDTEILALYPKYEDIDDDGSWPEAPNLRQFVSIDKKNRLEIEWKDYPPELEQQQRTEYEAKIKAWKEKQNNV